VRYGTGEVVLEATDLHANGCGTPWGYRRSFASRLTQDANVGSGYNWQVAHWPYLVFPSSTTAVVIGDANEALWFDQVGAGWLPRFDV
jgi:hypothetical protein